jgi:hypothetical protein
MSKSLAVVGGDLAIQSRAYKTVTGRAKLIQDLRSWVLEPVGTDPATPDFGTRLEGVLTDTEDYAGVIGGALTSQIVNELQTELYEQVLRYQQLQVTKMQDEVVRYDGQTTLDPDEVIQSVDGVDAVIDGDAILVQITLTTFASTSLTITIPVKR